MNFNGSFLENRFEISKQLSLKHAVLQLVPIFFHVVHEEFVP